MLAPVVVIGGSAVIGCGSSSTQTKLQAALQSVKFYGKIVLPLGPVTK